MRGASWWRGQGLLAGSLLSIAGLASAEEPVTDPRDQPAQPVASVPAPVEPVAKPWTTPPWASTPWTAANGGADLRLTERPSSIGRETGSRVFEGMAGISVFADYLGARGGPFVATSLRIFSAFELHLGVTRHYETRQTPCPPKVPCVNYERVPTGWGFGLGANFLAISIQAVEFTAGIAGTWGNLQQVARSLPLRLILPLYAHWLPFRLPNARLRLSYDPLVFASNPEMSALDGLGGGLEWGLL